MTISEKDLYEAAPLAFELWMEEANAQMPEEDHVFSRRFERKMNKLIRNQRRTPRMRKVVKWAKIASVAAAAVIAALGLFVVPVNADKEHLIDVVSDYFDGHASYTYTSDDTYDGKFGTVTIGYIPERMQEISRSYDKTFQTLTINYEDSAGYFLDIEIVLLEGNTAVTHGYDTDNASIQTIKLRRSEATLITDSSEGSNVLFWTEGNYLISISGYITTEEAIDIAESIELVE